MRTQRVLSVYIDLNGANDVVARRIFGNSVDYGTIAIHYLHEAVLKQLKDGGWSQAQIADYRNACWANVLGFHRLDHPVIPEISLLLTIIITQFAEIDSKQVSKGDIVVSFGNRKIGKDIRYS